jgi:peptidyl-prolyl cis-trans isomerase SurA
MMSMKKFFWAALSMLVVNLSLAGQSYIAKIGGIEVAASEFERTLEKNRKIESLGEPRSLDEYLELFINFKLKVRYAEDKGLDTSTNFLSEYSKYSKQLIEPYLFDESIDNDLLRQAYDRMQWDIRTSHILIRVGENDAPRDTMLAFDKISRIRQRLLAGEDFEKLARSTSEDPSAKENGGDIGYGTAFSAVYPYENMMYSTSVGEVSPVFRTKFGFHVLKVIDKRPSRGQVKARHIMIGVPQNQTTEKNWQNAQETMDSIYAKIKAGASFADLAMRFSTDTRSAGSGGEMDWVDNSIGLPQHFKDTLFSLKDSGNTSLPFTTNFGYHIVQLIEKRPFKGFEESLDFLRAQIAKDQSRANRSKSIVIAKLKKRYSYNHYPGAANSIALKLPENIHASRWQKPDSIEFNELVFSFAGKEFRAGGFADWLAANLAKVPKRKDNSQLVAEAIDIYAAELLLEHERKELPNRRPELAAILSEYREGLLLFEAANQRVWKKSNTDTLGLLDFFNSNRTEFMWGTRLEAEAYYCKDAATKQRVMKQLPRAKKRNWTSQQLLDWANKKEPSALRIEKRLYSRGSNPLIDKIKWEAGAIEETTETTFVYVAKLVEPEPKELSECRGAVVSMYQKYLEDKWLAELKTKYQVELNMPVIESLRK